MNTQLGGRWFAAILGAVLLSAGVTAQDAYVSGKVLSVGAETSAIEADRQMRVEIDRDICNAKAGDSVPIATDRAHNAAPGSRVRLRVRFVYAGQGVVDCACEEGRLSATVLEVRR